MHAGVKGSWTKEHMGSALVAHGSQLRTNSTRQSAAHTQHTAVSCAHNSTRGAGSSLEVGGVFV